MRELIPLNWLTRLKKKQARIQKVIFEIFSFILLYSLFSWSEQTLGC